MNQPTNFFRFGIRQILPIMTGVIPFGAVMGTAAHEAGLSIWQSMSMNLIVYAGASQLAAVDLMTKQTALIVVVATGLIINFRFLLYSAAFSPYVRESGFGTKLLGAYLLTDQNYAVMSAHESHFKTNRDALDFYFGSCLCMTVTWHLSVLAGYMFGNFSPRDWALDYAVPLSFVVLVVPTLKNQKYVFVAACSALCGILFHAFPFSTGLLASAFVAMIFATVLSRKRTSVNGSAV